MVEKKLLTVACAVGILACGACFLPPPPERKPQPPPLRIDLTGITTIRVEVANGSETHRLDGADLAGEVARAMNARFGVRPDLRAYAGVDRSDADAELKITVESEALEDDPTFEGRFVIRDSATLARRDGAVLWQETNSMNRIFLQYLQGNTENVWRQPLVEKRLEAQLASRLVYRMLYVR
jgi:hypothetical protein